MAKRGRESLGKKIIAVHAKDSHNIGKITPEVEAKIERAIKS